MSRYLCRSGLALLATMLLLALAAGKGLAQEGPSIVITAPTEGQVLSGPDITVSVALSGFTISLPLEPKREPNKGHIVYFLDVEPFFDAPVPLGEDNIIHSGRFSETFVGVADGEHTIYVCLVYDDNTCIDSALADSVPVSVGEPLATATPSPEATPTPEPPPETPSPTSTPTEKPPPLETAVEENTPALSPTPEGDEVLVASAATPTPVRPSPTARPPTAVPLTPAATPVPGIAPGTAGEGETGFPVRWYAAMAAIVGLIVVGALALWWVERTRSRR